MDLPRIRNLTAINPLSTLVFLIVVLAFFAREFFPLYLCTRPFLISAAFLACGSGSSSSRPRPHRPLRLNPLIAETSSRSSTQFLTAARPRLRFSSPSGCPWSKRGPHRRSAHTRPRGSSHRSPRHCLPCIVTSGDFLHVPAAQHRPDVVRNVREERSVLVAVPRTNNSIMVGLMSPCRSTAERPIASSAPPEFGRRCRTSAGWDVVRHQSGEELVPIRGCDTPTTRCQRLHGAKPHRRHGERQDTRTRPQPVDNGTRPRCAFGRLVGHGRQSPDKFRT